MTYENFEKLIKTIQAQTEKESKLRSIGIDIYDFNESYMQLIDNLISDIWNDEGCDWINWFMWTNDFGNRVWNKLPTFQMIDEKMVNVQTYADGYGAHDENGNPICYDIPSLYEYVKQYEYAKIDTLQ